MPHTARTPASGPCTGAVPSPHPRLVHLNGPPGVGKSTLARLLGADDPGALVLDADVVVAMIAGWRDDFWATLPAARRLGAAMARDHLAAGHDVLLPQLVTSEEEIAPYLTSVAAAGATYVEVVLLADAATADGRFTGRVSGGVDPVAQQLVAVVADGGGDRLLAKIRGDLLRYLEGRDPDLVLDTTGRTAEQTYRDAARVLRPGTVGATG